MEGGNWQLVNGLFKNIIVIMMGMMLILSGISYAQDYASYVDSEVQAITSANLLKSNDATLPVYTSGNDEILLTVFFDYNCHASRELLKVINQKYSPSSNSKVKVIFRPMDYGFNSKEVLQAVLYAKNLTPSKFEEINKEIIKIDSPLNLALIQQIAGKININFQDILKEVNANALIQSEIDKNKQDFESLPYPNGLNPQFRHAIPVMIVSRVGNNDKFIYFLGSNQNSLETAITNIKA